MLLGKWHWKYVEVYKFLSFARTSDNKYGKKLMSTSTETGTDAAITATKRVVQKTAEATGGLIGNKIADKVTLAGKSRIKVKEKEDETNEIQEIYIPPENCQ